jgi:sugar O-acyltransferase (sialic acid O-acetyltransferase NeuD family)
LSGVPVARDGPQDKEENMSNVVIFGTGEFAQVASIYLEADSPHKVVAFCVDRERMSEGEILGKPVVAFEDLPGKYPPGAVELYVAIGFKGLNHARAEVFHRCKALGYNCIRYVCSRAIQWGHVEVGENTFVFENNVLQPFVRIGDNCVLWSGNHIGHHARVGDHCFITSHVVVSGGAEIGDYCFLGVNATVGDHMTVAAGCVIGAGALVLSSTEADGAYLGNVSEKARVPANRLRGFQWAKKAG